MFPSFLLEKKDYQVYDVGGSIMHYDFIEELEIDGLTVYKFSGQTTFDISDVSSLILKDQFLRIILPLIL